MTAKEHLQQVYMIQRKINRLEAQREDLRADLYSVKSPSDMPDIRVQTSLTGDKMLELVARVDEIERGIIDEINVLVEKKISITSEIEKVPNENYKQLLFDRYILCRRWEQIAIDRDKSVRTIFKMHGRALNLFEKVIKGHCLST